MLMPTALKSEAAAWKGRGWRAVEAQHKNATMALVHGSLRQQSILEEIIESAKPSLPVTAGGLHFLLSTPFRYQAPPPDGSRFRAKSDPAVFYGAESIKTACAEAGYWRLRFWIDSAGLGKRPSLMPMTLFEFHGATLRCLYLTRPPFNARRAVWANPGDYRETQALARKAREEGVEMIRYESARLVDGGRCLAILTPDVFRAVTEPYRHQQQTWNLFIEPPLVTVWQHTLDGDSFEIRYDE
jgi:hypothetical protein